MVSVINLEEPTIKILERIESNPNQLFNLTKHELPSLLIKIFELFSDENKEFGQDFIFTGGGFDYLLFWIKIADGKFIIINTMHNQRVDKNDQEYNEVLIYLYDESDNEIPGQIDYQSKSYGNEIPLKLDITCPKMGWHVFYIQQLLFDYREDN